MRLINRHAITVKGKQPFIDWINSTKENPQDKDYSVDDVNQEPHIFLIPSYEDLEATRKYIKKSKPKIFEYMLNGWYTLETSWPKARNAKVFDQWFDVEYASMLNDLEEKVVLSHE